MLPAGEQHRQSAGTQAQAPFVGLRSISQPETTLGYTKAEQQEPGPCP